MTKWNYSHHKWRNGLQGESIFLLLQEKHVALTEEKDNRGEGERIVKLCLDHHPGHKHTL